MESPAILQRRIDLLEERDDLLTQKNNEESNLDWITTSELGKQVNRDGRTILKWINLGKFSPDLLKKVFYGKDRFIYRLKNPEAVERAKKILMGIN